MSEKTISLRDTDAGADTELPVVVPTMGRPTLDVRRLPTELGYFTFDPGFGATASCESAITFIDGGKGVLLYRGYPIEQLAEKSTFLEVAYLLMYGELPTAAELADFEGEVTRHTMVHEKLKEFLSGFHYDAHPMAMMVSAVGGLSAFYHDSLDMAQPDQRRLAAVRMLAKMPTLAALCFRHSIGWPAAYPRNDLDYCARFLDMMFSVPAEDYKLNDVATRAINLLFILHADHEQNASTSTVRLVGSTGADPYASVAAGISALWGPAHGGANEAVLRMLDEIGDASQVDRYVAKAKDRDDPFRLMGFGHRVYKNFDPRATIIRKTCHEVLDELGVNDPRFELAMQLERVALEDDYFRERKLYPNVDFYSGIIYSALGIPTNMFTVLFAIARTAGWVAQWLEQHEQGGRIGRPRQVYVGATPRDYVPAENR